MKHFAIAILSTLFAVAPIAAQDSSDKLPDWIWANGSPKDGEQIFIRENVDIPADTRRAILVAAGDNQIDVYVNGARRPATSNDWGSPAVEDISDQLDFGEKNLIAARAKNEGGIAGAFIVIELIDKAGNTSR